jgi:hypothetical protein
MSALTPAQARVKEAARAVSSAADEVLLAQANNDFDRIGHALDALEDRIDIAKTALAEYRRPPKKQKKK